jgi:hypothetical protein
MKTITIIRSLLNGLIIIICFLGFFAIFIHLGESFVNSNTLGLNEDGEGILILVSMFASLFTTGYFYQKITKYLDKLQESNIYIVFSMILSLLLIYFVVTLN